MVLGGFTVVTSARDLTDTLTVLSSCSRLALSVLILSRLTLDRLAMSELVPYSLVASSESFLLLLIEGRQ